MAHYIQFLCLSTLNLINQRNVSHDIYYQNIATLAHISCSSSERLTCTIRYNINPVFSPCYAFYKHTAVECCPPPPPVFSPCYSPFKHTAVECCPPPPPSILTLLCLLQTHSCRMLPPPPSILTLLFPLQTHSCRMLPPPQYSHPAMPPTNTQL